MPCLNDKGVAKTYSATGSDSELHDAVELAIGDVINTGLYKDGPRPDDDLV